ncbi:GNAT family N-acetyltransferase [Arthrobacter sp. H5]|uniref:GNAT family N-acetyltransferase n=1 Tax=Arthrobacter sp. H5 TaxID=1267973 RepID=UPI000482123E|nr:GNAT family N-acetyltransferase [Arthrobacter sp. H5]
MTTEILQPGSSIRIDKFTVAPDTDHSATGRLAKWFEAVGFGFHEARAEAEDIPAYAAAHAADHRTLWGAYDDDGGPHRWDVDVPVATYGTMVNTLNVGRGRLVDTHLVTAVTVRPTHRRRGLLRRMMTEDLQTAADNGLAIAALTASEATIYGRFGFGAATLTRNVEVDVRERFAVLPPAYGRIDVVEASAVVGLSTDVFARFHERTLGSIGRQYSYPRRAAGVWGDERPKEDKAVRTAVHYDDDGQPDGYVSYKFAGWETQPYTMKVVDLVAATDAAYLELWRYLGSIDLVERVTFGLAAADDPLPWALADRRSHKVTGDEDVLWLRILDPVKALEARGFAVDGAVSFTVKDTLAHSEGAFTLSVSDGGASVHRLDTGSSTDATMDVAALGSMYLGGVSASTLAVAGHITPSIPGALETLDSLFNAARAPYCITHF